MFDDEALRDPTTVIFVHVPKTGGVTLRHVLYANYQPHERLHLQKDLLPWWQAGQRLAELPESERRRIRLMDACHYPFGFHHLLSQPCTYVTILRDPLERAISNYYYSLSHPENQLHERVRQSKASAGLESVGDPASGHFHSQVLQLAGVPDRQTFFDRSWPKGPVCEDLVEQAKKNLRNCFSVVGIQERYAETLFLCKHLLGLRHISYEPRNKTADRPSREDLPPDVVRRIEEQTRFERLLYDYAVTLFEQRFESLRRFLDESLRIGVDGASARFHAGIPLSQALSYLDGRTEFP